MLPGMVTSRPLRVAALVAVTAFALAACDLTAEPSPGPSEPAPSTAAAPTTVATPTETEPAGLPVAAAGWDTDADGAPVGWQLCQAPPRGLVQCLAGELHRAGAQAGE